MSAANRLNLHISSQLWADSPPQAPRSVAKFRLFTQLFAQLNENLTARIPETLVKRAGGAAEFYHCRGSEVAVTRQRSGAYSAEEEFLAAIRSVEIAEARVRASPFKLPLAVAHLPTRTKMLFSESEIHSVATCGEFVVQRFISSIQQRACKHRVCWCSGRALQTYTVQLKNAYPYNSPNVLPRLKGRRNSHVDSRLRPLVNTQQLRFPQLSRIARGGKLEAGSKSTNPGVNSPLLGTRTFSNYSLSVLQHEEDPYIACFSSSEECMSEESQSTEVTVAAESLLHSLQSASASAGLALTTLRLDFIHGHDNLWYFIDLKAYSFEAIDEKIRGRLRGMGHETRKRAAGSPLRSALEDLKGFFMSEKPLSEMKAPYIDKQEVVSGSVELYRRFSLSL